jgi:hypothetical protein
MAYLCLSTLQFLYPMNSDRWYHTAATATTNCKPEKSPVAQLLPNNAEADPGGSYAAAAAYYSTAMIMVSLPRPALPDARVLCLTGEQTMYGQTFNRIITVANTLAAAAHDYPHHGPMRVGLDLNYSRWYDSFLERPELVQNKEGHSYETLLFYYEGECTVKVTGEIMYWKFGENAVQSQRLPTLLPKLKFRRQAEQVLQQWRSSSTRDTVVVTVHRRNLDGKCQSIAHNNLYSMCHGNRTSHGGNGPTIFTDPPRYGQLATVDQRMAICEWDYATILKDLKEQGNDDHGQVSILLLTDGQVPALDRTFPQIGNYSFPVEAWLMVLSDIHYGNPFSTVDYVVYSWRRDVLGKDLNTMRPSTCYP